MGGSGVSALVALVTVALLVTCLVSADAEAATPDQLQTVEGTVIFVPPGAPEHAFVVRPAAGRNVVVTWSSSTTVTLPDGRQVTLSSAPAGALPPGIVVEARVRVSGERLVVLPAQGSPVALLADRIQILGTPSRLPRTGGMPLTSVLPLVAALASALLGGGVLIRRHARNGQSG